MAGDLTLLPGEVIQYILEDKRLSFPDILRFGLTCKHLYQAVTENNNLWRTKFFQRWPHLQEAYHEYGKSEGYLLNWKKETEASFRSRQALLDYLYCMSRKHYEKEHVSDYELADLDPLYHLVKGAHPLAYHFFVDELVSLINNSAAGSDLTHKYYAFDIVRYLKQNYLKQQWQKFVALPCEEQILERGATLVAQWSQPTKHIWYSHISMLLDDIVKQTKELLMEQHPTHSIFSISPNQLELWKHVNIDDNQWSVLESRQVIYAICNILFDKLGFHGNSEMYYIMENSFIDHVLEHKRGIPITLAIVFESVARRLGIRCEPVTFPSHFLLRWKERYTTPDAKDTENFYIDVFNGGRFLTKKNCPRIGGVSKCPVERYNVHAAATAVEVISKMAKNLEVAARQHMNLYARIVTLKSALKLMHMIQPYDTNPIVQLGQIYMLHQMDPSDIVTMLLNVTKDTLLFSRGPFNHFFLALRKFQQDIQSREAIEPKRRTPDVKYAVGLIMRHKISGYLYVITGWYVRDKERDKESIERIHGLCVDEFDDEQTFYNVCGDGHFSYYVTQENLLLEPVPRCINHFQIGRYFCKFNGTYYVPNEEMTREYPEDAQVRDRILANISQ